jgi:predicted Fe-Mo cluster-binding NifX family protein
MLLAMPIFRGRISPVLDVARQLLVLEVQGGRESRRWEVPLEGTDLVARARQIGEIGAEVLVCGGVSRSLEAMLLAAGLRVIPNTCGPVGEVIAAFLSGQLTERAFLMPGCHGGRRRRLRRRGGGGRLR